ncbi:hypothetical protein DL762_004314 [Monosporascus cannonballus]|uniref:Uncharacterized protein n=1 Tax=Monosporascus cannonballus TaxID=155416 RepID=A0ABY0H823_9PEZI|nr:hypothetical protein DL762_004314 [Monosporascus cannonballus]
MSSQLDKRQRRPTAASDQANGTKTHDMLGQEADRRDPQPIVNLPRENGTSANSQREKEISELFKAARVGNASRVEELLAQKEDPNWLNRKSGQTVLFAAVNGALSALKGKPKDLQKLLEKYRSVLEHLLAAGARVGETDSDERTPLLLVASEKVGNRSWIVGISDLLLRKGARIEATDRDGRTPLICAAINGHVELAELLLERGANVESTDHNGRTPLMCVAANGNVELAKLLLSYKANVRVGNNRRRTALHLAAESNREEVAKLLLDHGANPSAISDGGWMPLHNAAQNGHEAIVQLLLDNWNPDANDKINPNAQLYNGMTPLHWAAFKGSEEVVRLLLATKPAVNIGIKDSFGRTPMLCAAEKGFTKLARMLSPAHAADRLSQIAKEACDNFQATVIDFKVEARKQYVYKYSVSEALYAWGHESDKPRISTFIERAKGNPDFRWIHLPANNIAWAEVTALIPYTAPVRLMRNQALLAKRYEEGGYEDLEAFKALEKCFDQEHRGRFAHSHFMRPFCQRVGDHKRPNMANIVMPFLHHETHEARKTMSDAIMDVRKGRPLPENPSKDCLLVHAYLTATPPLQPRRTLDQHFYDGIDTTLRDTDQVVYRYCEKHKLEKKVYMVDQLWLWVMGKDLVITCFPERWNQPTQDPMNVLDGIIEDLNAKIRPPILSVHDLALLIMSRCSGAFDRHRLNDQNYQFLEMFGNSVGSVADAESRLFRSFNRVSRETWKWLRYQRRHRAIRPPPAEERPLSGADHPQSAEDDPDSSPDQLQDQLLNIVEETSLLTEIKDIKDELSIIDVIFDSQLSVLTDYKALLPPRDYDSRIAPEIHKRLEIHRKDIKRMDGQADSLYLGLTRLLDLKQKHSNALEARFAGDQAAVTAKQGQTILVFTIVTIIFLPMSFIATFFSIDIEQWDGALTVGYVSKYMFGIGLSISIPLIVMAFTLTEISNAASDALSAAKRRLFPGLRRRSGADDDSSDTLGSEKELDVSKSQPLMLREKLRRRWNTFANRCLGDDLERGGAGSRY